MRPRARMLLILGALTVAFALVLAVNVLIANHEAATSAEQLSKRLDAVVSQIQTERENSIRNSCEDQNRRHRATIRQLDRIIDGLPVEQRRAARERSEATVLLIEALVPLRRCEDEVRRRVQAETP